MWLNGNHSDHHQNHSATLKEQTPELEQPVRKMVKASKAGANLFIYISLFY
jgi:hypothetical protein